MHYNGTRYLARLSRILAKFGKASRTYRVPTSRALVHGKKVCWRSIFLFLYSFTEANIIANNKGNLSRIILFVRIIVLDLQVILWY